MSVWNGKEAEEQASQFVGKVVLISGAGRGLGRALAQAFAARGAILAANDLTPINLDETVATILAAGGKIQPYLADIAGGLAAHALVEQVCEDWGRLDILINNAAVEPRAAVLDMDEWDWQRTLAVNLSGPFLLMQAAGRRMRQQGGGVILNIAGSWPAEGTAGRAAFLASKTGLVALSRVAAQEFLAYNISVHTVCPGERSENLQKTGSFAEQQNWQPDHLEQAVRAVLSLCNPATVGLPGQVLELNPGGAASVHPCANHYES